MQKNLAVDISKVITTVIVGGYLIYCLSNPSGWHFVDDIDLVIHEAGHSILRLFGEFIMILGGSLFQVLIPLIFSGYFFLRRDFFASSLLLSWLGYNLVNISVYISDSIAMQLELLGGDSVIHDWNYLLTKMGLLLHTHTIGSLVNGIGFTIVIVALLSSLYFSRKST